MENLLLLILTASILINAAMVILSKNPIHSILFLVLVFVSTTGLLLMLGVEFIAMLFLVVYVGAITVLFLFVIMMLNVKIIELNERLIRYLPMGLFIGLIFFLEIFYIIDSTLLNTELTNSSLSYNILNEYFNFNYNYFELKSFTNIQQVGNMLYTKFVYLFLLAGFILLIAMIGAIVLTLNQKFKNKQQDYYRQTNRNLNESVFHVK